MNESVNESPENALTPQLMASIIESANDAIISKTLDGIITSWNKGAEIIFGYTAKEVIGQSILLLIPPRLHNEEKQIIARLRTGERIEHFETVRRRKDGDLIDISLTISPVKDDSGQIVGASKIARDITDIKRIERDLKASEDRYHTLFNTIDEGFCVIQMVFDDKGNPIDYLFLEVNPAFEHATGLVDAVGQTMRGIIPNHEDNWFEIYGRVAKTGESIRFENRSEVLDRWFDLYAFRVGEPGDHKVAVLFTNITERKKSEQERERLTRQIEAERSKLAYLFNEAPAFFAILSGPEHIFELTNPSYLQLIGHRDVIGKPIREALPEVVEQGFVRLLDKVFQNGEPFIGREALVQLQQKPNSPLENHFLDFVYQPIFEGDGSVSGVFVHGVDISAQVQARKDAENANRTKDEFLATLSHELRTPLNAILGWSQILGEEGLDVEARKRAQEIIQRNAKVQVQLIEDILDVSRIVSGKLKLEVRPLELSAVIEAAAEAVLPAAEAKGIRLQRVLDYGSSLISGDADRLQQVVWNLLSNAIKFTPKGGRVQIRLERVNSHVEIIVADTGMGIAPEVLPHVFDRFHQADSTTTRQHGGLGLGLAIVRHLVEMHGGTVRAESHGKGEGATFTVDLPLIALRSVDRAPENERREHPTARSEVNFDYAAELDGIHVLVVDDEEDARTLVATVLQRCGATVTAVGTAASAFDAVRQFRPDVLLSDIGMPGEDGYSLIKKIRSLPIEQGGQTPAAALTAFARLEDRMRVLRAGFQMHIPKPVEPAELVAVVTNLSGRHD